MWKAKDEILGLAKEVDREVGLKIPMPALGVLVSTFPIDAALHDAFCRVNRICSYDGYSREYMERDLSSYLGEGFRRRHISDYRSIDPHRSEMSAQMAEAVALRWC